MDQVIFEMNQAAVWILVIYSLANAGIIWYFFIYKQNQIDKEYREWMKKKNSM